MRLSKFSILFYGKCVHRDGLAQVLGAIRNADGLIIGSPNYLGDVSAGFRALYERLIFQSLTYMKNPGSYNDHRIPVLMIMTSNTPAELYVPVGYSKMLKGYKKSFETFVGNTKLFVSGNTLQVKDYSRFKWNIFDPDSKKERHEKVFPNENNKAFRLGAEMVKNSW